MNSAAILSAAHTYDVMTAVVTRAGCPSFESMLYFGL